MVGNMGTETVHTCVAVNKQWLKERWKGGYMYTHVVYHTCVNRTLGHIGINTIKNYVVVKTILEGTVIERIYLQPLGVAQPKPKRIQRLLRGRVEPLVRPSEPTCVRSIVVL